MRTLEFNVSKQELSKKPGCDFSNIVAGSYGYLRAQFNFSGEEWENCEKSAHFWKDGQCFRVKLTEDGLCEEIPYQALRDKFFEVSVVGKRQGSKDRYFIETNKYKVKQIV